jgi:TolB-like protein
LVAFNFISKRNLNADITKLEKSIAVLPLINDSPDTVNLYFCNGMMDEILTQLQKIGNLKVKARTSVEKYRNPDKDIKDIGKELGVYLIMEGSVRKIDDNLHVTAQLINAKSGDHLWAETYDGKYTTKIFEFQSNVAKKVAASLDAVITPEEKQQIEKVPTDNLEAYTLYLRGTYFWEMMTAEGYKKASEYFEQALQKDPDYALAYIGLANINGLSIFFRNIPPHEAFPKAAEYVHATSFYIIYRVREEENLAFEWLKRACTEHDTYLPGMRGNSYFFPEGSRYLALLKEVGL